MWKSLLYNFSLCSVGWPLHRTKERIIVPSLNAASHSLFLLFLHRKNRTSMVLQTVGSTVRVRLISKQIAVSSIFSNMLRSNTLCSQLCGSVRYIVLQNYVSFPKNSNPTSALFQLAYVCWFYVTRERGKCHVQAFQCSLALKYDWTNRAFALWLSVGIAIFHRRFFSIQSKKLVFKFGFVEQ